MHLLQNIIFKLYVYDSEVLSEKIPVCFFGLIVTFGLWNLYSEMQQKIIIFIKHVNICLREKLYFSELF